MNLTIVLVHNKGDQNNQAQIDALKPFIIQITDTNTDELGNIFNTYHYELQGLPGINIKFFQIIPFNVINPPNLYDIDSFKVFYGKGDEDKTGNHPRFFNYGNRFPIDSMGADVIIHCDDHTKFTPNYIKSLLPTKINDNKLRIDNIGKIITKTAFLTNGEVNEFKPLTQTLIPFMIKGDING